MRGAVFGVAILWVVIALALFARVSFASVGANVLAVFIAMTVGIFLALAWSRRIPHRSLVVLATLALSGIYLFGLLVLGWGLALDPWVKPDLEVRQNGMACRAVYFGEWSEVRVFKTYPLGLEYLQSDYLIDGSPNHISCESG